MSFNVKKTVFQLYL